MRRAAFETVTRTTNVLDKNRFYFIIYSSCIVNMELNSAAIAVVLKQRVVMISFVCREYSKLELKNKTASNANNRKRK